MTQPSKMMNKLYPEEAAQDFFERLEKLDKDFNKLVQEIAYDYFWALPGLSNREKCIVAMTSLIVLGKPKFTQIHFHGFMHAGGTSHEAVAILLHLRIKVADALIKQALTVLLNVLTENQSERAFLNQLIDPLTTTINHNNAALKLTQDDLTLVEIAAAIASDNFNDIDLSIANHLSIHNGNSTKVKQILMHQTLYCGFPSVLNGFSRLSKILTEQVN
jgi:alkylhydroperoxidase/carboxymuconolactone decarboxylase family protein YurZ